MSPDSPFEMVLLTGEQAKAYSAEIRGIVHAIASGLRDAGYKPEVLVDVCAALILYARGCYPDHDVSAEDVLDAVSQRVVDVLECDDGGIPQAIFDELVREGLIEEVHDVAICDCADCENRRRAAATHEEA